MDADVTGPPPEPLEFTGERMVPEGAGRGTFWEHIYRYQFALRYVRGRDVLDVACGEGYGTAGLAAGGARSVVGVDIDETSVRHARRKYGIDARQGDAARLPLPDDSADVVVSFETIEHVPEPARFVAECRRVLRPGGRLVISTPNVTEYNPTRSADHNPYHCSEMTEAEFVAALAAGFGGIELYSQRVRGPGRRSDVRSLSADPSPWLGTRGFGRLRSRCRVFDVGAEPAARRDPVRAIVTADSWLGGLTNPYRLRRRRPGEPAVYLVAVARSAK